MLTNSKDSSITPILLEICVTHPCDKIKRESQRSLNETNSIFPDELLKVPPKFAISRRNYWMVKNSDYVITYVTYIGGGAATFKELAEKKKRIVYNIAE